MKEWEREAIETVAKSLHETFEESWLKQADHPPGGWDSLCLVDQAAWLAVGKEVFRITLAMKVKVEAYHGVFPNG